MRKDGTEVPFSNPKMDLVKKTFYSEPIMKKNKIYKKMA